MFYSQSQQWSNLFFNFFDNLLLSELGSADLMKNTVKKLNNTPTARKKNNLSQS